MTTHSSLLAWEIPWTEEPAGLQSLGSQRVRHDLVAECEHELTRAVENILKVILIYTKVL